MSATDATEELIPCPHCGADIDITTHGPQVQCSNCGQTSTLAGHLCPDCFHYHDTVTAVCHRCGETINRICRHCHTPNWAGDELCQNCDHPLDILEVISSYTGKATEDRLYQQMATAQSIKEAEEEASRRRISEMEARERERQTKIRQKMQKRKKKERKMLFGALLIVIVFLVVIVAITLITLL